MGFRGIVHTKLRSLSRQSLTPSQQRYGQIVTTGMGVGDQYDAYIQTLGSQLE